MESEKLTRLGFTNLEAKVYITLLRLGEAQAGLISKKAETNRTTTYQVLEKLLEKGLVTYTVQSNRKVFRPSQPKKIVEFLVEQEIRAKDLLPELNSIYKEPKEKEDFNIYKGKKGIISILQDILNCKKYIAFGSSGRFIEIMKHDFINFQKRKKELKISSRIILSESSKRTEQVKLAYSKFKYIPEEYSAPTTTFVYGNYIAIMVWSEVPIATVMCSKEIAKSYLSYFELLWKTAKK
ncbi:hypothetical protein HYT57_01160 [Candidatus Woesearchaeota archaeon]|nr:hypothetical protein [Candidatus Woesearchaeota archaeon]